MGVFSNQLYNSAVVSEVNQSNKIHLTFNPVMKTNALMQLQDAATLSESCMEEEEVDDSWEYAWDYVCILMESFDMDAYLQADPSSLAYSGGPIPLETFQELEESFSPRNTDAQAELNFCMLEAANEALLEFAQRDTPVNTSSQHVEKEAVSTLSSTYQGSKYCSPCSSALRSANIECCKHLINEPWVLSCLRETY